MNLKINETDQIQHIFEYVPASLLPNSILFLFYYLLWLQMQQWFSIEGDRHLLEAESVKNSGDRMEQILNSFTAFLIEANVSLL